MNLYLFIAGVCLVIIGGIHSVLGEKLLMIPLLKQDLPLLLGSEFLTKRTLRLAWHFLTLLCWAIAIILMYLAAQKLNHHSIIILKIVSVSFFIGAVTSLLLVHGKHFTWYAFLIISIMIWLGAR